MSERKRILCIDDHKDTCAMLVALLTGYHLDVSSVSDYDEALLKIGKEEFDLYIVDSALPGQPGLSLCAEVRAIDKKTPIIIYSGRATQQDQAAGLRAGANEYITKPNLDLLIAVVLRYTSD